MGYPRSRPDVMFHSVALSQFLDTGDARELVFEQLPFSQPLFILYSSGTSGKPKCIVHSAGVSLSVLLLKICAYTLDRVH